MSWQSEIRSNGTAGPSFDVTTEQIISFLEEWSERSDFAVSEIGHDRLTLQFARLPEDVDSLAEAIYELCPDTVEQGFGCIDDALDMCEETGETPPAHLVELVEGLDLDDPKYGVAAMARSLRRDGMIMLWWD